MPYLVNKADLKRNEEPTCAKKAPYKVTLEQGKTYYWCTCGRSENQPFCDGKHKETKCFKPLQFEWKEETQEKYLCGCKHNKVESGPFCDGSHKKEKLEW